MFGYVDCYQSIKDWRVEHYRFSLRPNKVGFDICEIRHGKPRRVQGDLLPFTRKQLLGVLQENRNAGIWDCLQQQLLSVLEHRYCLLLEAHGYSVFHMVLMSRYVQQDYPYVYWLVLLRDYCWISKRNNDDITRDTLARSLGVATLSSGQMKALRKLEINGDVVIGHVDISINFIVNQWGEFKKLTAHVASVKPVVLQMAVWLLKLQPKLIDARWFSVNELQCWLEKGGRRSSDAFVNDVECRTSALCLLSGIVECMVHNSFQSPGWESTPKALQELLRLPNISSVQRKSDSILKQRVDTYLEYDDDTWHALGSIICCESFSKWRDDIALKIAPGVGEYCEGHFEEMISSILDAIRDALYNREQEFEDSRPFCKISSIIGNVHFSCIDTAGHLREISELLRNCASHRVHLGVDGKAEFWLYRNDSTRENALLQLGVKDPGGKGEPWMQVVEFNGYDNAGVSSTAKQHLYDWLSAQTQKFHDFSGGITRHN